VGAIHLVRHCDAGHAPDEERSLTDLGRAQAEHIAELLAEAPIARILTSRYRRCIETVTPLAERLGVSVETHPALCEEADVEDTWALVESSLVDADALLCSHGNLLAPVLDRVLRRGAEIEADEWTCHKGSIWRLENDKDRPIARAVLVVSRS
jgi:phosphohistidine phosphatase SixA